MKKGLHMNNLKTKFVFQALILLNFKFKLQRYYKFNIHGTVHRSMTSSNNQQNAT